VIVMLMLFNGRHTLAVLYEEADDEQVVGFGSSPPGEQRELSTLIVDYRVSLPLLAYAMHHLPALVILELGHPMKRYLTVLRCNSAV
jgi:hypothetical protein